MMMLKTLVFLTVLAVTLASIPIKSGLRVKGITEESIGDKAISSKKIQRFAVENSKLQNEAVDGNKITRFAVDERHLQPRSVTTKGMALEQITIILRAETPVSTEGGGSPTNPTNRILLKPQDIANTGQVENHYVSPDGFYHAYGKASGPGQIIGWYPSLNGHLLRYQADRALRDISCSSVHAQEHKIRKEDINVADQIDGVQDLSNMLAKPFLARYIFTGIPGDIVDTNVGLADSIEAVPQRWPGVFLSPLTTDNDTGILPIGQADSYQTWDNMAFWSAIVSESHVHRIQLAPTDWINDNIGVDAAAVDFDLRGSRDSHYLSHRYSDLRYQELCGDLVADFGPDNVKCRAARPWIERRYHSNDVVSLDSGFSDAVSSDTNDNYRPDFNFVGGPIEEIGGFQNVTDVGGNPFPGFRFANRVSPPERCSIYTNIGDVRTERYLPTPGSTLPIDQPGPAEGTPIYSPSVERIQMDESGEIEIRYAGRGMPGASQPDIAITVMVLLNNKVQHEQFGSPANVDLFP